MTVFVDKEIATFIETKFPELNLKARDFMGNAAVSYFESLAVCVYKPAQINEGDVTYYSSQLPVVFEPIDSSEPLISFDALLTKFTNFINPAKSTSTATPAIAAAHTPASARQPE